MNFLQRNAEQSLKNLKHFSFSDLEIVSKSAQKVCAKLAEKMRDQIQDEDLGDVVVNIQGNVKSEDHPIRSHLNMLNFFQQKLGKYKNEPWLQEKDLIKGEITEDMTVPKTEVQKGLFEILFPWGHRLRDIEIRTDMFFQKSKSHKIREAFGTVKITVF